MSGFQIPTLAEMKSTFQNAQLKTSRVKDRLLDGRNASRDSGDKGTKITQSL